MRFPNSAPHMPNGPLASEGGLDVAGATRNGKQ